MTRRSAWLPALALAPALMAAACASAPPPDAGAPPPPAPESWSAEGAPAAEATGEAPREPWWLEFSDPHLGALIGEALRVNYDLRAALARLDAAAEQARIAGADLSPQVGAALDGARRRQNFIGLPIPGAEGRVLSNTSTTFGVSLDVSWEVDLWRRLRAGRAAAAARTEAALEDLEAARQSLAAQTAKAWFALVEAHAQVEVATQTLDNRRLTSRQIRRRYDSGLRSALDLRQALAAEANAEAELGRRLLLRDNVHRQLQLLLTRYPGGADSGDTPLTSTLPPPADLPALPLPGELMARRPDLRAAERRLQALGFDVAAARAALYPRLLLSGSAGRLGTDPGQLPDGDFSVWSVAERLLQPLFQGGRLRAAVRLNEARLREAAHRHAARLLAAYAEVEAALDAERALAGIESAAARGEEQASAARAIAEDRYRAGLADYLRVLDAQRQESAARSAFLTVRRQRLDARIDLHLAVGGEIASVTRSPERAAAGSESTQPNRQESESP